MTNSDFLRQIESAVINSVSNDAQRRQQAYSLLEEIKSNPNQSISFGFQFFDKSQQFDPLAKHFGLQCIEEAIKYKWTSLDGSVQSSIKERLWLLMTEQTELANHLKTILVRCVCEIAKREWPQQWSSFLNELVALSKSSLSTIDYPLLILAYLVEDVIVLQTLNSARKRDIQSTLLQHANELIGFSEAFLDSSSTISSCLHALTMFATFFPIEIFFSMKIIHRIVVLLNSPDHRIKAAEFLTVIADRRGKYEDRVGLLELFSYLFQPSAPYNDLYSITQTQQPTDIYNFMKQYAMVLTVLCEQFCYLCGNDDSTKRAPLPEQFSNGAFFRIVLTLIQHPSPYISLYGYQMWLQLVKVNVFQENDYQNILPLLLSSLCNSLVKVSYSKPNQGQEIASFYIRNDFDDESDYQKFLGKSRSILIRTINSVCSNSSHLAIAIRIGFDYAEFCFQPANQVNFLLIDSLIVYWQTIEKHLRPLLKPSSTFNQNQYLDENDLRTFCHRAQTLIEHLLKVDNNETLEYLAYSLRLVTSLYVFTGGDPTWTRRILEHVFRVITTERTNLSKSNSLQKQSSCLIDLCLNYGHVICIYFNDLFQVTKELVKKQTILYQQQNTTGRLAGWQWSILVESLGILLNYSKSFQESAQLIHQLVQPFAEILTQFDNNVKNLSSYMNYTGLVGPITPEICTGNSSQRLIFLTVHILCGLLRRITIPDDATVRSAGGYEEIWNEILFVRNPAAPSYLQFVRSLFNLFNYGHSINQKTFGESPYTFLMSMTDAEKAVCLQQESNEEANPNLSPRKNSTISNIYERRLHNRYSSFLDRIEILVGAYFSLKPDIYKLPDALNMIGTSLFSSLDVLPDFRLRNIIRNCFTPFIENCSNQSMMTTILEALLPFMYNKLKGKWKIISERQAITITNEKNHQNNDDKDQDRYEEVIEERVLCYLTRDFIHLLKCFLIRQTVENYSSSSGGSMNNRNDFDENSMDETPLNHESTVGDTSNNKGISQSRNQTLPTEYALKILRESPITCESCLLTIFDGLSWSDTSSVTKMLLICHSMIKHLSSIIPGKNDLLRQLYIYILCALKTHGDNEPIICNMLSLAISIYETFLQTSTELLDSVLMEIPGVTIDQVNAYRTKMQRQLPAKPLNDKEKRDSLKSLVQPLMGQNIAQMFRREPLALNDLPPLIRFSKRSMHPVLQQSKVNQDENDDHGLTNLFQPNED